SPCLGPAPARRYCTGAASTPRSWSPERSVRATRCPRPDLRPLAEAAPVEPPPAIDGEHPDRESELRVYRVPLVPHPDLAHHVLGALVLGPADADDPVEPRPPEAEPQGRRSALGGEAPPPEGLREQPSHLRLVPDGTHRQPDPADASPGLAVARCPDAEAEAAPLLGPAGHLPERALPRDRPHPDVAHDLRVRMETGQDLGPL